MMAIEQKTSAKTAPGSAEPGLQKTRNTLQETWVELKKTTWPSKEEATRLTMVVIGIVIVLGLYMAALDRILSLFFERVL